MNLTFLKWPQKISWKITVIYTLMFILVLTLLNGTVYLILQNFVSTNIQESIHKTLNFILPKIQGFDEYSFNQYEAEILQDISESEGNVYFRILDHKEKTVAQSNLLRGIDIPLKEGFNSFNKENQKYMYKTVAVSRFGFINGYVQVIRDVTVEYHFLDMLLYILIITGVVGSLGAIVIGYFATRKTLQPISQMTETARNISVSDLDQRLEVKGPEDELSNLARTFNSMLDRIEKAFEQQKQFVSDASHELRTPISVIQGYIDLLNRWGKEEKEIREEAIEAIQNEVENINALLENLLFLARGDSEELSINKEIFSINELIDEIVRQTSIISKGINIKSEVTGDIDYYGDSRLLKQVLRIFIDNSRKFTPDGGEILIKASKIKNLVVLTVIDNGSGIAEEDLSHIFERFYQVDKSRSDAENGSGLGLAIAKWIIEIHNGEVKAESEIGEGTKIKVLLPDERD